MNIKEEVQDRFEAEVFTKTINGLLEKAGITYSEAALELDIPRTSFYELTTGSRSYRYQRLKKIASYFSRKLKDDSITLEYLLLGSDEVKKSLDGRIEELEEELKKEQWQHAWKQAELKQQLAMKFDKE